MDTRSFLINTLKLLEQSSPPPKNAHHAITYARYGSNEDGWEDRLALQVNVDGTFHCLFLDAEDFAKTPQALVSDIMEILPNGHS